MNINRAEKLVTVVKRRHIRFDRDKIGTTRVVVRDSVTGVLSFRWDGVSSTGGSVLLPWLSVGH
jgi:hypothetical protein